MSVVAAIRDMLARGLTVEQALIAAETFEASMRGPKSNAQRQAEWRDRQKTKRNESNENNETVTTVIPVTDAPPIKETSPTPPKENYPLSSELSVPRCVGARRHAWPEDFADQLWAIYPRKTEKKAGMEVLARLHRADRTAWADIVGGVEAMAEADPQFVPALARWLRGERWKDERPAGRAPPGREPRRNSLLDGLNEIESWNATDDRQYPRLAG